MNNTAFNFTLEVFYTGGGDLQQFSIKLQQGDSSTFTTLKTVAPVQSQTSPRLWYAVVVNRTFEGLEEPRFNILVVNAMQQSVTEEASGEVGKFSTTYKTACKIYCFVHCVSNLVPLYIFSVYRVYGNKLVQEKSH